MKGSLRTEAEKFWPVYDQYAAELSNIHDVKLALLEGLRQQLQRHDK
jgi:hypothetical protein